MDKQGKKSKNIIKALFVFLAILVLVLIGAIVYFYLTGEGDFFPSQDDETVTCACYYIDPQVTSTCGDSKRGFKFNTAEGTLESCSSLCPKTELSTNLIYSNTKQDSYLTCNVNVVANTQCTSMEITTEDDLLVTGKIPPDVPIIIKATFDSQEYTDYKFLINNQLIEPDEINGATISKTISDYEDASTLQVSAQAVDNKGDTVGSEILCKRLIEITTTAKAGVTQLSIDTYTGEGETKIRSAFITAGGLDEDAETLVKFTFEQQTLTMIDGFEIESSTGKITFNEIELYDSANFSELTSFEVLNNYEGEIEVTAEVLQDSNSLGTAITTVTIEAQTEDPETDDADQDDEDDTTATESSFSVSKTSSVSCVERVSPDNTALFTITVTNNGEVADTIESIKDKLPLGFVYTAESSTLNDNAIADSVFVTITDVGDSQEIVWEPQTSWSIAPTNVLIITFAATAADNAISGENLNEVIITPTEIPDDPSTLRTSTEIIVAQDCDDIQIDDTPQTGIFDTTIGRVFVGIIITLFGLIIYNSNQGNRLAHMIINSAPYKDAEMTSYRIFRPKKYFEEKILKRRERKT